MLSPRERRLLQHSLGWWESGNGRLRVDSLMRRFPCLRSHPALVEEINQAVVEHAVAYADVAQVVYPSHDYRNLRLLPVEARETEPEAA